MFKKKSFQPWKVKLAHFSYFSGQNSAQKVSRILQQQPLQLPQQTNPMMVPKKNFWLSLFLTNTHFMLKKRKGFFKRRAKLNLILKNIKFIPQFRIVKLSIVSKALLDGPRGLFCLKFWPSNIGWKICKNSLFWLICQVFGTKGSSEILFEKAKNLL